MQTFLLAVAFLLLGAALAPAADLEKIERKISREPAYQSKAPKYCLLVFGPQAKTRIWLVQDGDVLYVDRNGNGDLTDKGERIELKEKKQEFRLFEAGDIPDGPLTHTGLVVMQMTATAEYIGDATEFKRLKGNNAEARIWTVRVAAERPNNDKRPLPKQIKYIVNGDGLGFLQFGDSPQKAPIIHFNGPWTLELQDLKQQLIAGDRSMLQIGVGTPGVGPGTFAFVEYPNTIPADAYPVAQITFPPKAPKAKAIQQTFTLKERC
jgi:hypothetical protein